MEDEFDKLMKSFDSESQKTEQKLEEIFKQSMGFFDKFKHILETGSEEDKIVVRKKMEALRSKLNDETQKSQSKLKMSAQEIKEISNDSKNFTPKQWEFLQQAQGQLYKEKEGHDMKIRAQKEQRKESLRSKKKKKSSSKKSSWLKS